MYRICERIHANITQNGHNHGETKPLFHQTPIWKREIPWMCHFQNTR